MFKIVAFDMDGTIADTIPMCIQAFQNSISPYVDHELGEKEIMKTFGLNEIGQICCYPRLGICNKGLLRPIRAAA